MTKQFEEYKSEKNKRWNKILKISWIILEVLLILLGCMFLFMVLFPASSWGGSQGWLEFLR